MLGYLIAKTSTRSKFVMGENFNAPNVGWSGDGVASQGAYVSDVLLDLAFSCGFGEVIIEPTRITVAPCSVLDVLFVSKHLYNCSVCSRRNIR